MLTDLEFRVWAQYLLSADDFGVMHATAVKLQSDNLHLANRPAKVVARCLEALVTSGLIRRFEHQGQSFVFQRDWQAWQKVEYPRATDNPKPPTDALAVCDDATRALFAKHPGGQRMGRRRADNDPNDLARASQTRSEHLARASRTHSEDIPTTRAGAPAERLTANGLRLTASSEGGAGETPRLDLWFERLKGVYPPQRVSSGHLTMTAFVDALVKAPEGPEPAFERMLSNLANQKRGHEWRVKGLIPKLENWLRQGLWEQEHDPNPPLADQVTPKTSRTLQSAANILRGES